MIVTIDGPAGAGKSTVARALAERLHFTFLDTGAMYRAVTLAALRAGIASADQPGLHRLLEQLTIVLDGGRTLLNEEDVSREIRTPQVTEAVRHFADNAVVRAHLTRLQRAAANGRDLVTEGRDQGTVVFPSAECKFFLTADETTRARRRHADFQSRGQRVSFEQVQAEQYRRDQQDQTRRLAPLRPAPDAQIIDTTGLDILATIQLLETEIHKCLARREG